MRYYVRRILMSIVVFFVAVTVAFTMYRLLPSGPIEIIKQQYAQRMMEGGSLTPGQLRRISQLVETYTGINPDKPIPVAYYEYWRGIILHLDFGKSIRYQDPVFDLLFEAMPWSIFISIYGLVLGTTVSLLFGAMMAHREGSMFDKGMTVFTIINSTIPYYIVAIVTVIIFGFNLKWFPTGGKVTPGTNPGFHLAYMIGVARHAALPIFSLFIAGFGGALAYRGNCIREKGKDYTRVARLRGVSENRIALRYVGRNSLLPVYTTLLLGIAGLFGSGIIIEVIFNYRAMGLLTYNALLNRDYPLLMGSFIFFTGITVLGILIADLTYGIIDPRVQGGSERESF